MRVYPPLLLLVILCANLFVSAGAWAAEPAAMPDAQVLVNPQNPIPAYLEPQHLMSVSSFARANNNVYLREDAAQALKAMLAALKQAGVKDTVYINSGYRNFVRQGELYAAKVSSYRKQGYAETQARAMAARWVLPAGESEHQTGLAVDISTAGVSYELIDSFAKTAAGKWLHEHCVEYGFIVRYTAAKEEFTSVASEPWHFRYVGSDHAVYMREHDLCLEEYHALLIEQRQLLFVNSSGGNRAVYYSTGDISANLPGTVLSVSIARRHSDEYIITMSPPPVPLFDTLGHWGEQYIRSLYELRLINGYPDGSFRPNAPVSRGEFVTMFSRLPLPVFAEEKVPLAVAEEQYTPPDDTAPQYSTQNEVNTENKAGLPPYPDIDESKYYYQPLTLCFRATLVQPMLVYDVQPQLFQPEKALLRREAALMMAALMTSENFHPSAYQAYYDVSPDARVLYQAVDMLTKRGIFQGDGLGLFYPEREISRAEISAIFIRLLDALQNEEPPTVDAPTEDIEQEETGAPVTDNDADNGSIKN
ncbi:MAG: D-alanyl-D-alanine carboxypeptidase family protein [Clostridiales bacterium]|nr:D-alanyl-D-alanine carboxypeptidase family protein [Clostridiales bacterium]